MTTGIYLISNKENGNRYIGSSVDVEARWKHHAALLNKCIHHSRHLQNAWNLYGADSFEFSVLLICSVDDLIMFEQRFIDVMKPEYNVSPTAGRTAGVIRTEEYRRKQSISQSNKVISPETRQRISDGMRGKRNSLGTSRIISDETKKKISATLSGHEVSENTRKKLSEKNSSYRHTEEARKKISEASKGNKYNLGRVHSEATKEKRSESLRAAWQRRKAAQLSEVDCGCS